LYIYSVKISTGAIVCSEQTKLEGDITIGAKTVIHPTASIIAESGPIIIGDSNLIEENVQILNLSSQPMIIGSHNVFEVGSHSQSPLIGDHNVLEPKSRVGAQTRLSNGCVIGSMCSVDCDQLLVENTVIFGSDCKRRIQHEKPPPQTYQLDFLSKILPNYQRIEKPNYQRTDKSSSKPSSLISNEPPNTSRPDSATSLSPQ